MKDTRIILICGDRDWTDPKPIHRVLKHELRESGGRPTGLLVIEGGARGADRMAALYAKRMGIHVAEVDALWNFYHRSAGPTRNGAMLTLKPDMVYAFHSNIKKSKGTANMLAAARRAGIPHKLIEE